MARDIYQEVTDRIVAAIEAGVSPWQCPWNPEGLPTALPISGSTGKPYRGVNVLLLWSEQTEKGYRSNVWLTFNQAKGKGGNVRKGEKGTHVTLFRSVEKTDRNGAVETDKNGDPKSVPFMATYVVFNEDQIDGLPKYHRNEVKIVAGNGSNERVAEIDATIAATGATIHERGTRAFFSPTNDEITIPPLESFESSGGFYVTLLHECVHWTGHSSRLDRKFGKRFGDDDYAFEELIAEIGSAFLCAKLGVDGTIPNHASYLASWLKVLKSDKHAIFTAATAASKAADLIAPQQQQQLLQEEQCETKSVARRGYKATSAPQATAA